VVLAGPGSLGLAVAYLGILRAEAVAVLGGADATERELSHLVSNSGAVAAFAGGDVCERLRALERAGLAPAVVSLDRGASGPTLEETLGSADVLPPPDHDGDRTAVLGYTSGTTGTPKGAELSHSNLLASLRGIMLAWRWRGDDVLVHALPLSHQHGLSGLQATLLAGARAVIHASLDPARLCKAIAAEHATVLFAVPAVYERLLTWDGSADFSSLRLATCGSAPLSPRLWQKVAGLLGQEPLERYGTTETGLDVSNPYDGPRRPGSVGLPLPGIEVEVADESGRPVAVGKDGEIRLRGPHVCTGYWRDDEATRASFNRGGWFRTGDIGRVDAADGYLSITGRLKELIISGGLNVYPREVELVLEEHPSVERGRRRAAVGAVGRGGRGTRRAGRGLCPGRAGARRPCPRRARAAQAPEGDSLRRLAARQRARQAPALCGDRGGGPPAPRIGGRLQTGCVRVSPQTHGASTP
jgi:malonyl-CoA/methylmalonyl-CoA synthetase